MKSLTGVDALPGLNALEKATVGVDTLAVFALETGVDRLAVFVLETGVDTVSGLETLDVFFDVLEDDPAPLGDLNSEVGVETLLTAFLPAEAVFLTGVSTFPAGVSDLVAGFFFSAFLADVSADFSANLAVGIFSGVSVFFVGDFEFIADFSAFLAGEPKSLSGFPAFLAGVSSFLAFLAAGG